MLYDLLVPLIAFLSGGIIVLFYLYISERNLNKLLLANYKADLEVVTTTLDITRAQLLEFKKAIESRVNTLDEEPKTQTDKDNIYR